MLVSIVAGPYSSTFSVPSIGTTAAAGAASVDSLGVTSDNGYELSWMTQGHRIDKSDDYSKTLLDGIMQGAEWHLRFQCVEYPTNGIKNTSLTMAWPWGKASVATPVPGSAGGPLAPYLPFVGQRWSDISGAFTLTAIAGTPAATNPGTLSAPFTIVSPETKNSLLFTTKMRVVTVDALLLPYGVVQPFQYPSLGGQTVMVWFLTS